LSSVDVVAVADVDWVDVVVDDEMGSAAVGLIVGVLVVGFSVGIGVGPEVDAVGAVGILVGAGVGLGVLPSLQEVSP